MQALWPQGTRARITAMRLQNTRIEAAAPVNKRFTAEIFAAAFVNNRFTNQGFTLKTCLKRGPQTICESPVPWKPAKSLRKQGKRQAPRAGRAGQHENNTVRVPPKAQDFTAKTTPKEGSAEILREPRPTGPGKRATGGPKTGGQKNRPGQKRGFRPEAPAETKPGFAPKTCQKEGPQKNCEHSVPRKGGTKAGHGTKIGPRTTPPVDEKTPRADPSRTHGQGPT